MSPPSHTAPGSADGGMRAEPHQHDTADTDTAVASSRAVSPAASSPPPAPAPASATPLLTASLNAPPQSFYGGLNGNVRVKRPTDLSVPRDPGNHTSSSPSQGLSTHSSNQAVFYSTLLKQLRHKAGDNGVTGQHIHVVPVKIKKEKCSSSKSLPFMCPACKKRFQRHIAMNAHFQNEHISAPSAAGERSCKLCGSAWASLAAVRAHLRTAHSIDLDNPASCLAELGPEATAGRYSVLEASLRGGNTEATESEPSCSNQELEPGSSSSCVSPAPAPAHSQHPSSSEQSPGPGEAAALCPELGQVEDLSVRRPVPSPSPGRAAKRPRQASPAPQSRPASPAPGPAQCSRYTCTHCNISYPNQTLYLLHKGFHSDSNPWRCNGCGHQATDLYDFNSHLFSAAHQ